MNLTKIVFCFVVMFAMAAGSAEAKKLRVKQRQVYMIGVGVSHLDSAVFITDLQPVENVTVQKKTGFLMDRQVYSQQLQTYLKERYKGGPYVPAVYFSPKLKKMERQYLSLHKRYSKGSEFRIVLVEQSQFRFKAIEYIGSE